MVRRPPWNYVELSPNSPPPRHPHPSLTPSVGRSAREARAALPRCTIIHWKLINTGGGPCKPFQPGSKAASQPHALLLAGCTALHCGQGIFSGNLFGELNGIKRTARRRQHSRTYSGSLAGTRTRGGRQSASQAVRRRPAPDRPGPLRTAARGRAPTPPRPHLDLVRPPDSRSRGRGPGPGPQRIRRMPAPVVVLVPVQRARGEPGGPRDRQAPWDSNKGSAVETGLPYEWLRKSALKTEQI